MHMSNNVYSVLGVYNKIRVVSENRVDWLKNNLKFHLKLNNVYKKLERCLICGLNAFFS